MQIKDGDGKMAQLGPSLIKGVWKKPFCRIKCNQLLEGLPLPGTSKGVGNSGTFLYYSSLISNLPPSQKQKDEDDIYQT